MRRAAIPSSVLQLIWTSLVTAASGSQLHHRRVYSWSSHSSFQSPDVPPSAPPAVSALNLTVTTLPPSMTTSFSPQDRLGSSYEDYQNEMKYGRPNINATDKPNLTASVSESVPTTAAPPLSTGGGSWWNPGGGGGGGGGTSPGYPTGYDDVGGTESGQDDGVVTTTTTPSPPIAPSSGETSTDTEMRNESALDCTVGEWTEWEDCRNSGTEGIRSWHETRYRPVTNPHYLGGLTCLPRVMRRPCPKGGWSSASAKSQYGYGQGGLSWEQMAGGLAGNCPCSTGNQTGALLQEGVLGATRGHRRLLHRLRLRKLPQASGHNNNHGQQRAAAMQDEAIPRARGRLCACAEAVVAASTAPPMK